MAKTGDHSDEDVKRTSHNSGVGEGATTNPIADGATANPLVGLFGADATVLGLHYAVGIGGTGSLPFPTTLPSMATLEALTDDLEKLSGKMFKSLEETNIAVYDKVLQGFKDTSGKCKGFIHDMGALVVTFFAQAEKMEQDLAKCDAEAFHEALNASKGYVCGLIQEVAEAEGIYNVGEVSFDSILVSVTKEIKAFVRQEGEKQRKEYKQQCLARIEQNHGRLDGMCFIPMIIGNLTAHQALAMSQQVAHSPVPLKIMTAPLCTQAGTVKVYMKFVEFLARRVIALQERLGPHTPTVLLESEPGAQLILPRRGCSSLVSPTCKSSPPPKRGSSVPSRHRSPVVSRHGSPLQTNPGKKALTPAGIGKDVFSPHSQSSIQLWATMDLSDEDVDDTFTDEEGKDKCQTPLPPPGKRSHHSSDDEKSPSKKAKLDVSNLYGTTHSTLSKGDGNAGKGDGSDGTSNDPEKSKAQKHKKVKKNKKKRSKKNEKDTDKKDDKKDKKKPTGDKTTPEKKKTPEKKMPEKTKCDPSGDENSETPTTPKSKKKPIRMLQECRRDKWASDSPLAISYRQRQAIFIHNLPEGHNYDDHTDFIRQLIRHETLGVNIKHLDDRIQELQGLMSSHHVGLLVALKEWKGKQMGNSGITPQYVVKAFAEPV